MAPTGSAGHLKVNAPTGLSVQRAGEGATPSCPPAQLPSISNHSSIAQPSTTWHPPGRGAPLGAGESPPEHWAHLGLLTESSLGASPCRGTSAGTGMPGQADQVVCAFASVEPGQRRGDAGEEAGDNAKPESASAVRGILRPGCRACPGTQGCCLPRTRLSRLSLAAASLLPQQAEDGHREDGTGAGAGAGAGAAAAAPLSQLVFRCQGAGKFLPSLPTTALGFPLLFNATAVLQRPRRRQPPC